MKGGSRRLGGSALAVVLFACLLAAPAGATTHKLNRYSIANGCYSLAPASSSQPVAIASRQRFKATRLGSYMLYGVARDFLAASSSGVDRASAPSPDANWKVTSAGSETFQLSPELTRPAAASSPLTLGGAPASTRCAAG